MHKQHVPKLDDTRHEAIARHLAKGRSQTESYRLAGYAEDNGNASRLCTSNDIQARVNELKAAAARRAEVSIEFVLTNAKQLLARCMQKEPVMMRDEEGNMVPSGEWKFDASGAAKALDMIAKHLAMYEHVKRSEVVVTQTREIMAAMPEADFAEIQKIMLRQRASKND